MMLRHLHDDASADKIERALTTLYAGGEHRTGDLGGKANTKEFTDALCKLVS